MAEVLNITSAADDSPVTLQTSTSVSSVFVGPIFSALVFAFLLAVLVKRFLLYHRLRHVPGPWHVGISSSWLAYHTLKSQMPFALDRVLRSYDDPILYRSMVAPRSAWRRGRWFEGLKLDPRMDNIVSERDEKRHAELRSKLMPGYSGKDVETLEANVEKNVLVFADLIRKYVDERKSFDFAIWASYFTLDTLTEIAFGQTSGFLANNQDMFDYFKTTSAFYPIMELGMNVASVQDLLSSTIVQALAGPKPSDKVGLGPLIGRAYEEVATRFGPDAKPDQPDMLGSFVRNGLTRIECESETIIQVMAGSDSTAQALRTTFWHIISSPTVYSRLGREIEAALDAGDISYPVIKDAEAKALPYLQACIREGLRVFQPLVGHSAHVAPPEGCTHKGIFIPGGTEVGVALYSMMRKEELFGPDANTYHPERFIDGDPMKIRELEDLQDMNFGYGRYSCLGKRIALMEVGKLIFELLRRYDFTVVDPLSPVITRANGTILQENMVVRAWSKQAV